MSQKSKTEFLSYIMETDEDGYHPSEEDERDYWSGEGHLEFTVISHSPKSSYCPYEIEWHDYSGCVGGLQETFGIEYSVNEGILDVGKLRLGFTYKVHGITVQWTRGDDWTTDDDVDYYVEEVHTELVLSEWLKAWWWHLIGWRIREWRNK